jgi:hypothetical protein
MLSFEEERKNNRPVAWRDLDYGPTNHESTDAFLEPRVQWNLEQATRRALRSLEARGLVELGTYSFIPVVEENRVMGPRIVWWCQALEEHVPGESRYMTGVMLTDAGRDLARTDVDPRRGR